MSEVFFQQMEIPKPAVNLGIHGGTHARMTAEMLIALEELFLDRRPDLVLVYGDTNSTLAATLAASKLHIPVGHVEAGLRSFDRRMPEEQNRIVTDHLSELLLAPTEAAEENLHTEGLSARVKNTGDVMYDASRFYYERAVAPSSNVDFPEQFVLMTLHRAENTDDPTRLKRIMEGVASARTVEIVLPLHPRTRKAISRHAIRLPDNVRAIDPVGYLEMIFLERRAKAILTDSGGVQKEAYFFEKPCGTLRDETEWIETVTAGSNIILGSDPEKIAQYLLHPPTVKDWPAYFGDGRAGNHVVEELMKLLNP
jgi:UDP-GlcNAc3NAcA epimerase